MITTNNYIKLRDQFWDVASWAVWDPQTSNAPKSNVGSLKCFNDPNLLDKLNTGFVFVGLNGSGKHEAYLEHSTPWYNFHSSSPRGNDFKLRYALSGTSLWGSYITDIIKYYPEVDSKKVVKYARNNPEVLQNNINIFKEELKLLGDKPIIVALGTETYKFIRKYLDKEFTVIKVPHYSHQISKENYRKEVLSALANYL